MRTYESTFILSPQADDAAFDQQIKAITDLIASNDGKIIQEDRWGIRRMAFPIQKFTQGYYTRLVFEGNNALLTDLERFYKLEEPYIRYLTILFEGDPHEKIFGDAVHSSNTEPVKKPFGDRGKPADNDKKPAEAAKTAETKEPEKAEPVAEEVKAEEPSVEPVATEPAATEPTAPKAVKNDEPEKTEDQGN